MQLRLPLLVLSTCSLLLSCSSGAGQSQGSQPPVDGISAPGTDSGSSPTPSSSDDAGQSGQPEASTADASLGNWHLGGTDASAGEGGGGLDASLSVQSFTSGVGPITINAGQEVTYCVTMRLTNPDAIYVPRITATLAPGSHHLVVYRSQATTENLTPTPCTAFAGVLGGNAVPMLIAQTAHAELTFPQGVALKLAPTQMIELEAHYINTSATALQGQGSVTFESLPASTAGITESDFAFFGTYNIALLANSTGSVGPLFVQGIAGTHGFAVTTHQHRLGTRFRIWYAQNATDTNHTPVADNMDWANAPLYHVNPEMVFDGTNGVAYKCEWDNTTTQLVTFGESALQEMCFMWMYYYPSHGFDFRTQ
jgi:hypothetical protein